MEDLICPEVDVLILLSRYLISVGVVDIEQNRSDEVQLAEQTVFTKTLDPATASYVKDLLIPKPGGAPVFDTAYSMFLGYDIGLDPKNYGN